MQAFVRTNVVNDHVELQEVSIPEIGSNEVLVQIHSFGIGVHDRYFIPQSISYPYTIGSEGAGVIYQIGRDVTEFKKGERVIVSTSLLTKGGSWGEYVAVPLKNVFSLPEQVSFAIGATLPIAGKTAMESLALANLKEGDTLFIAGGSGAIGTLLIQLATLKGIRVIASASNKNQVYMRSLGAEKTVDYKNENWKDEVKKWHPQGVDVAIATQPGTALDSMDVVRKDGSVILFSGEKVKAERNIQMKQVAHGLNMHQVMNQLTSLLIEGTLHVTVENIYPFQQALEALEKTETRHAQGKSVVMFDHEKVSL